jgi:nucleotide-binding universal stress UspA family protein
MEDIQRILVVTRSTKYCQKAVHYAVSLSKKYDAEIIVLHVIHNPFGLEGWNVPIISRRDLEEEYRKMFEEARAALDRIIDRERTNGLPIKELVVEGDPQKTIFEIVEKEKIDLLVMIAYEQGRIEHWLFGRGTDEIVRRMPCSVLLIEKKIGAS